jgi:hypothetical protein
MIHQVWNPGYNRRCPGISCQGEVNQRLRFGRYQGMTEGDS